LATRFSAAPGLRLEALGDEDWVAYIPHSGQTQLLNEATVAILEALQAAGEVADPALLESRLALDAGLTPEEAARILQAGWPVLLDAGLITATQC
jgi:hypothetical protein